MTEDGKRLLYALAAAVALHTAVIAVFALSYREFEPPERVVPMAVEIVRMPEPLKEPEIPEMPEMPRHNDSPVMPSTEPEAVPEPAEVTVPAPVKKAAEKKVQPEKSPPVQPAAAPAAGRFESSAPDESLVARLRSRQPEAPVSAYEAFGEDRSTPSTSRETEAPAEKSRVVPSEISVAREEDAREQVTAGPETSEGVFIEQGVMERLDRELSDASIAGTAAVSSGSSPAAADTPAAEGVPDISFIEDGVKRTLKIWGNPEIPDSVRKSGQPSYSVTVRFVIDEKGLVSGASVIDYSGSAELDSAVLSAVRKWKFEAETGENNSATVTYVIKIK